MQGAKSTATGPAGQSEVGKRAAFAAELAQLHKLAMTPELGNTGVTTHSQSIVEAVRNGRVWAAYDYVEFGLTGLFVSGIWADIRARLGELQVGSQEGNRDGFVRLGGREWSVSPGGAKRGGCYCRFVLKSGGVTVLIRDIDQSDSRPSIFVSLTSEPLMVHGYERSKAIALELVEHLGFTVMGSLVSRVDIKCDVVGADVDEMTRKHFQKECVRRSTDTEYFESRGKFTGFVIGSGGKNGRMVVYDKLTEMEKKKAFVKLEAVKAYFGFMPEKLARVEYQIRRDLLRDRWKVNTLEDLDKMTRTMCQWLALDYYRQTEAIASRAHTHEAALSDVWQLVVDAFECEWGMGDIHADMMKNGPPRPEHIRRQAMGCCSSFFASRNDWVPGGEEELKEWLYLFFIGDRTYAEFVHEVRSKRKIFCAEHPT